VSEHSGEKQTLSVAPPPAGATGLATVSLVLGIVGLVLFFAVLPSILALVIGIIAMSRAKSMPDRPLYDRARTGMTLGLIGIVVGVASLAVGLAFFASDSDYVESYMQQEAREDAYDREIEINRGGFQQETETTTLQRSFVSGVDYELVVTDCFDGAMADDGVPVSSRAKGTIANLTNEFETYEIYVSFSFEDGPYGKQDDYESGVIIRDVAPGTVENWEVTIGGGANSAYTCLPRVWRG
jgi:hypothetical protein